MLNTVDIKTGGGTPKTLQPGNQKVKILSVMLEDFTFKPGAINVVMNFEGEDQGEGFEGFFINKDNEALGRHKGQVGKVKSSEYAYMDGETKSGIKVSRDTDLLKLLKNLCVETGCEDWLRGENGKHKTVQSLFEAFNNVKPFNDQWLNVCLAAKEYTNKQGYPAYDLFLPKYSKAGVSFESANKKVSKVVVFNDADHLRRKAAAETVSGFGEEGGIHTGNTSLDDDFKV